MPSLPTASAVEVIESVPSVCLCVCKRSHDWIFRPTDPIPGGGYFHIFGDAGVRQHRVSSWRKEGVVKIFHASHPHTKIEGVTHPPQDPIFGLCVSIHHGKRTFEQRNFTTPRRTFNSVPSVCLSVWACWWSMWSWRIRNPDLALCFVTIEVC